LSVLLGLGNGNEAFGEGATVDVRNGMVVLLQ